VRLSRPLRAALIIALTIGAAALGAFVLRSLHIPLAYILGAMVGAALVANLVAPMKGGRPMRYLSQLFLGSSVGVLLSPQVMGALTELFPFMLLIAVAGNILGLLLAVPVARLSRIDRLSGLLSCLPAGMAEMATLARETGSDEQSVSIIHTLRVLIVLSLVPAWLFLTEHPQLAPAVRTELAGADVVVLAALILLSLLIALLATRLRVINAFIIVPTLVCVAFVALGATVPAVPQPLLIAAQIGLGASLGLRFRFDRMRHMPHAVLGGLVSGLVLVVVSMFGFGFAIERVAGLDHVSALLAAAPGGLGEMIATASALGLAAATVAGFQLTRSIFTNLIVAPLVRSYVKRRRGSQE
jgi:membrane AbrB-like protein